jgi:hypothetical protein
MIAEAPDAPEASTSARPKVLMGCFERPDPDPGIAFARVVDWGGRVAMLLAAMEEGTDDGGSTRYRSPSLSSIR